MIASQTINEGSLCHRRDDKHTPCKFRKACHKEITTDAPHRSNKRLRFSEMSTLVIFPPRSDVHVQNSWYSKEEVALFKRELRTSTQALRDTRTAKAMKYIAYSISTGLPLTNIHIHGKEHIRGMEHLLSPDVLKLLFQRRRQTITRVLEEQASQKQNGMGDPSRLAQVSMNNSSFTREWAHRISNLTES